ncbi:MAG: hypothetical protein ACRDKS_14670 [Actinomycetota bacterium]
MVESNPSPMPKRRKILVDPELLKELEDLERRSRETDRRTAEVLARVDRIQQQLREAYTGR